MPLWMARGCGQFIGQLLYLFPNKQRRIYAVNISLCLPELSNSEQKELLRNSLVENFITMLEMPGVWRRDTAVWAGMTEPGNGFGELEAAMSEGKGVIMAGPHLGNWEVGFQYLASRFPVTALYRPPRQEVLDDFVYQGRSKTGADLAPANIQGVKKLITALRKGEMLFVLTDQLPKAAGKQGSVFAPFFGQSAATMVLVNSLARKTGAPVFFFYTERYPAAGGYGLHCMPAPVGVDDAVVEEAAAAINLGLEACIRQLPQQYLWGYKRFEQRPDGVPSPYSSRK